MLGLRIDTGAAGLAAGLLVTLLVAMLVCGSLNVMIEKVGYRPLRNAPKLAPLITAVGFSFILQNVGLLWLGGSQRGVPDLIHSQKTRQRPRHPDLARRRARVRRDDPAGLPADPFIGAQPARARRCAPPRRTPRPPG